MKSVFNNVLRDLREILTSLGKLFIWYLFLLCPLGKEFILSHLFSNSAVNEDKIRSILNYIFIITSLHKTYLKNQDETHLKKIVKLLSFYILQYNVIALKCCPIKPCTSCKNRQMFVCRTLLFGSRHVCDLFFPKFSFVTCN